MRIEDFIGLLGRTADDPAIQSQIGRNGATVERSSFPGGYFHLSSHANGINFNCDPDGKLQAVHFYLDGRDGFSPCFLETVLLGTPRREIHRKFGPPSKSGGGAAEILGRKVPQFDRFDVASHLVHVEYDARGNATFVTLLRPDFT